MTRFLDGGGVKWVDLTRLPGVQQVQLRVRIAEASRVAIRALGVSATASSASGFGGLQAPGTAFQAVSITPGPGGTISNPNYGYGAGNPVSTATTLFGGLPSSNLEVFLQALAENRYVRLLAEPNLVAVSGGEATFLVGGEFPVPIVQGATVGSSSVVTVQYKEFGVRLNFRPQVLGDGRIRLEVAPEVSELSEIGALQQNGFTVPGIVTRRSNTTVELGTGQSFAMAGLLRSKEQARRSSIPLLGDLPVLGALFRSMRYEQEETELVVIVTAELVEPLDRVDTPLPGEFHVPPSDWQFFVSGRIGGASVRQSPKARLRDLGLEGLHGPGAWRRTDDARVGAAEDTPTPAAAPAEGARE
jgi:pilus assembly protein CpaC